MFVVTYRKIFYSISLALVLAAIGAVLIFGLPLGIDFKGGSIMEVSYTGGRPDISLVKAELTGETFAGYSLRPIGEDGYLLRTKFLSAEEHTAALNVLSGAGKWPVSEKRFDTVGPSVGSQLRTKALLSIVLVITAIVLFVAFAFRKVSEPVSSWKYGVVTIIALTHDVLIPAGAFALLGHFAHAEVDTLFVTALLVILGFSVHDTIVVFDRVRENLRVNREYNRREEFAVTVGASVAQTFTRSINTSLTTVLALFALYFLGSETTQYFSLALIVGIVAGTYSSIFIASPLLVTWEAWSRKRATR